VLLPPAQLLLLERKFSWLAGSASAPPHRAQIARAGAVVDGPSIFEADLGHEIDNMEGIDAHVPPQGDTVLTMVSDDQFLDAPAHAPAAIHPV